MYGEAGAGSLSLHVCYMFCTSRNHSCIYALVVFVGALGLSPGESTDQKDIRTTAGALGLSPVERGGLAKKTNQNHSSSTR